MSKVDDFIKMINEESNSDLSVWVPSLGAEVTAKHLTVPQQKNIIKATLAGVKGNMLLPRVLNRIVTENVPGQELLLIDRASILVQLKIASLGTDVVDDDDNETIILHTKHDIPDLETEVEDCGITVKLEVPALSKDTAYYNMLEGVTYDNAGDIVNDMYVSEAGKFIKSVEMGGTSIEPTPKESIRLINELPLTLNKKILGFIKGVKNYENKVLTAENGKQMVLNARFFNAVP